MLDSGFLLFFKNKYLFFFGLNSFLLLILFRLNIEIFGSLLKNAIFHKKCYYIMQLLNRAAEINLALDEKAIKVLDKFKRETKEAMGKHVSIFFYVYGWCKKNRKNYLFQFFRIGVWKFLDSTETKDLENLLKYFALDTKPIWKSLK